MSLLEAAMAECVRLVECDGAKGDGMGGTLPEWREGERFRAALTLEASGEACRADQTVLFDRYTVTVSRAVALGFHDVFRRVADGAVFRVVSDGTDNVTPEGAGLDMRQVVAERWVLPG